MSLDFMRWTNSLEQTSIKKVNTREIWVNKLINDEIKNWILTSRKLVNNNEEKYKTEMFDKDPLAYILASRWY